MKAIIFSFGMAALLGLFLHNGEIAKAADVSEQIIEYQVNERRFAVVVVEDGSVSESDAKNMARQRAAEITVDKGFKYFKVISEQETEVTKSDRPFPDNQAYYQNMYQELIIEGDFDKRRLESRSIPSENTYPAIRLVFQCFEKKPWGSSVEACTLADCPDNQ